MRETVYYQREAPDPILDNELVLDIVRIYVPNAGVVKYIDESGGEGRVYAVDDNIILKVQRPQQLRSSTSLEKEAFFLRQLEAQTDANVPRVLGYGRSGNVDYLCMTRIPGVAVESVKLTKWEKNALLLELGKELRKIHDIDQQPLKKSGLFPTDDPPDLAERLRRRYKTAIRRIEGVSQERKDAAFAKTEEVLQSINGEVGLVAIHVNPYIPHVFVDEHTHAYTGIIDFGDSYIGHPIFDMWYWRVSSRDTLLRGYTSEKSVSASFIEIFDLLNHISHILTACRIGG